MVPSRGTTLGVYSLPGIVDGMDAVSFASEGGSIPIGGASGRHEKLTVCEAGFLLSFFSIRSLHSVESKSKSELPAQSLLL